MAKKQQESKVVLERTYNVPLRREFLKSPRYKRTNRAVRALREFLQRHMKSDDIRIGKFLNLFLWERGIRNPPHHVKVNVIKDDKGTVRAEIVGKEIELEKKQKKEAGLAERIGLKDQRKEDLKQTYVPKGEATEAEDVAEEKTEKASDAKKAETPAEAEKKTAAPKKPAVKKASPKKE